MWYQNNELIIIKNEVRTLCRKIHNNKNQTVPIIDATTIKSNDTILDIRGLEQRLCKNRQKNKSLAIWGILQAQKRNNDSEFIAMIAQKCTVFAKELAITQAKRDYCEVYDPYFVPLLSSNIEPVES